MLRTRVCDLLGIEVPIVQAGMASEFTNAELVAAVSEAGGLGVLGCLGRPPSETEAEIRRIRELTDRPFGVNLVAHRIYERTFEACLAARPPVFTFFRGEPEQMAAVVARAHEAGATVIYQVTTVAEAEAALAAGADALIAQGAEAGGHAGPVPLLSILPAVVALAGEHPVLAAGGIVDGPSLAAALCLGASGAWMGTRFLATPESRALPAHKRAIVAAGPGDTVPSGVWDALWDTDWPGVLVRAIRNPLLERWLGREDEIPAARAEIEAGVERAQREDDPAEIDLLAGVGAGRITSIEPAGQLVREIAADAERVLREWGQRVE
jgi:nitronate monooxygenase